MVRWASLAICLALLPGLPAAGQAPGPMHVEADLVPERVAVKPGEPFTVALRLQIEEGWHVYWLNPGDSGLKTTLAWSLPDGFQADEIQWPHPEVFAEGPYVTYAYQGEVFLLTEIRPPAEIASDEVRLSGRADWLVCKEICLPESAAVELALPVMEADAVPHSVWGARIAEARGRLPQPSAGWVVSAAPHGDGYLLRLDAGLGARTEDPGDVTFFAVDADVIDYAAPQLVSRDGDAVVLSLAPSSLAEAPAERLRGVLVSSAGWEPDGAVPALQIDVAVGSLASASTPASAEGITLGLAILLALLGGVILNLMPCVFPVLSLKILGFVQTAREEASVVRKHGWMFGAGVLASFLLLAGLLIALRAGGQELGWGFQLQAPGFVAAMAFLLFLLGLSLAGVYEIGASLIRLAGQAGGTGSYGSSFVSGVLATVVATPCTAPFMGSALGFALTQPALDSLLVFAALGVGMASPYVLLSMSPALLRRLPRPGAWMETFKQVMAFPLFATVVWLVWVFGQQAGNDAVAYLLLGLTFAAVAVWLLGRWPAVQISSRVRVATRLLALGAAVAAAWFAVQGAGMEAPSRGGETTVDGLTWSAYSEEAVAEARAQGRLVFVDFTAAWCLSCKVNERVALGDAAVQARFRELDVELLKADWTSRDPLITRALASFGRSGVPLYVLYAPDPVSEPRVLPEIITPGIVLDALNGVAGTIRGATVEA